VAIVAFGRWDASGLFCDLELLRIAPRRRGLVLHGTNYGISSLVRRMGRRHGPDAIAAPQRWLWEGKQRLLSNVVHLTVDYYELLENPVAQIARIVVCKSIPVTIR
jgi:hypothetical protein